MYTEIKATIESVKLISTLLSASKDLRNYNELASAVSEVNAKLLTATSAALTSKEKESELQDHIRLLEKELMEFKNWDREAERYQLTELCAGVFTFTIKPGMENCEPEHRLCTACFGKRQKGYLQRTTKDSSGTTYKCSTCQSEILDHSQPRVYPQSQSQPNPRAFY